MPQAPGGPQKRPPARRQAQSPKGHASAARARAEAEKRRRSRILAASGAAGLVVVLIVVLIVVKATSTTSSKTASGTPPATEAPTPTALLTSLASIPPTQLAQALQSAGSGVPAPSKVTDAPVTDGGKPQVLYVGAGYCPYCAAERWPLVTALLQFGTFTGLTDSHSSSVDINPNTPTFSFHGAAYTSQYLAFAGVETTSNQPQGNFYAPLDTPTAAQQALLEKYTHGSIPFIDLGGRSVMTSAQYDGKILAGLTVAQIAAQVTDPSTQIGVAVEASAATLVRELCQLTGGKPATVCASFPAAAGA